MSSTPALTLDSSSSSVGPQHHRGRRLRNFVLPDGREVHIALSPEEAESLRQRLTLVRKDEPFDLVINGSPEHLEALRNAHAYHQSRRESLREKHGPAFDEFENVRAELDVLSSELHMLTDHAVSLDANFSKYGYSAHLRTYDDASTPGSSANSIKGFHDDDHEEKKDWESERTKGTVMKLYKKPTVRQYFHKGLLWRASERTEVACFELFVDLLYVGILAINGDHASDDPTGEELLRFSITFIMGWKIWSDLALIVSWFATDDILQRLSVMFIMACLLGLTTNMLDGLDQTYTMLVTFYLTARLFMGSYLGLLAVVVPMVRGMMCTQVIIVLIPASLWVASIHVETNRLVLIWVAIGLEFVLPMCSVVIIRGAKLVGGGFAKWIDKTYEFYPAINIEHKVERTNAFVTLVFGYSVVAIIYQNAASFGLNAFFGKACLGLVQAFCFNWIYFELDGSDLHQHAIRRNIVAAMAWSTIHVPFIMSFVLSAGALSKLVLATDCANTSVDDLLPLYAAKSEPEIPAGLRWFYCAGLGIALGSMGIISVSHIHKDAPKGVRIPKRYRMINRLAVCIILCTLPTAHDLSSLQLVSTTTGLVIWVLMLELYGNSCPHDGFLGFWERGEQKKCVYTAKCRISKKDLETAVKGGGVVRVEQLSDRGEKGGWEI